MINQVEPQKIVERLNNILYKNINIFNIKGTIIASNDLGRVGEAHSAAAECVKHRAVITISQENKEVYPGCKEGVNLPILYEGKVIGAVGITGDPKQVRGYGLIVKELIEHIYYENSIKSSDALYQEMVKIFFFELFHAEPETLTPKDLQELTQRAKSLNIDYSGCFLVGCVFENVKSFMNPKSTHSIGDIMNYIRQNLGYCFTLYDNRLLAVARKTYILDKKLEDLTKEISQKFHVPIKFIYTTPCVDIIDYPIQYTLVQSMSRFNRVLHGSKSVYSTAELQEFFLLEHITPEYRRGYLSFYREVFQKEDFETSVLIQTIRAYFENDLSIKATALTLGVHRNTVVYRLQQFVDIYDIDVFQASSCMRLYLATLIKEMDNHTS